MPQRVLIEMEQIFIHLQKIVQGMDNLVSNLRAEKTALKLTRF